MVFQLNKMMMGIPLLLLLSLISACQGKPQDEKHVFAGQEQALRKAEAVSGQLAEQERKNRQLVQDAFR